ncbi:OmpW/AlkL family protein [Pelomicrobium methylotrophicum]|uniref:OmpW family protein n=1 Tax=Pelomicrobium methylotrophicum TaxID=2602750 RepID=A0A5C7EIL1_9PROT|nr:OmpW family outer membrane protein [Pelomicrobium methylotrophicum]TXF10729.1 OmpW family protein [Pelomicrobium methylotrophicum]
MEKPLGRALGAVLLLVSTGVQADNGDWLLRFRVVDIETQSRSSPLSGVDVQDKVIPEVDISYFLAKQWALELILTYPQKHDISLNGTNIGSVKHLPPTLSLQYHFLPDARFRPYVGAGINYTRFSDVNLAGGTLDIDRNSWGAALQAGADIEIGKSVFLNLDVKKVYMETDVKSAATGAMVTNLKIDPWLIGAGFGWRF